MRLPYMEAAYNADCCLEHPAVCLLPDIVQNYTKLCERHQCMSTRRRRLLEMAEPRVRREKYQTPCICPEVALRRIEIVQADPPVYTRTEQLAYPPAGNLMALKKHPAYKKFPEKRQCIVNRNLRKSLLSMYSRLGNTHPPKPPEKRRPPMSPKEQKRHEDYIKSLARPRKERVPKEEGREKKGKKSKKSKEAAMEEEFKMKGKVLAKYLVKKNLHRISKLAQPKKCAVQPDNEWHLTQGLKTYVPTPRILQMAQPRIPFEQVPDDAFKVKPGALTYKATDRIKRLALSERILALNEQKQENPFVVSRNALKAKTTQRIIELAEPKDAEDNNIRKQPFAVSRKALKAKLTKRLEELAQPKKMSRRFFRDSK